MIRDISNMTAPLVDQTGRLEQWLAGGNHPMRLLRGYSADVWQCRLPPQEAFPTSRPFGGEG